MFKAKPSSRSTSTYPSFVGGSLPMEPHDGLAPVAVTDEWASAQLVDDPLPSTIARVALPAVASSLLMTLFFSVDTFWIGTRVGAAGLAAASTAVFWIWLLVSIAEMVSVGLTALASRRHGEGRRAGDRPHPRRRCGRLPRQAVLS